MGHTGQIEQLFVLLNVLGHDGEQIAANNYALVTPERPELDLRL